MAQAPGYGAGRVPISPGKKVAEDTRLGRTLFTYDISRPPLVGIWFSKAYVPTSLPINCLGGTRHQTAPAGQPPMPWREVIGFSISV